MNYICSTKELRKAIRKARKIYVPIMNGNQTFHVQITKKQAVAIVADIERWYDGDILKLDVEAFGMIEPEYPDYLYIGGM